MQFLKHWKLVEVLIIAVSGVDSGQVGRERGRKKMALEVMPET